MEESAVIVIECDIVRRRPSCLEERRIEQVRVERFTSPASLARADAQVEINLKGARDDTDGCKRVCSDPLMGFLVSLVV